MWTKSARPANQWCAGSLRNLKSVLLIIGIVLLLRLPFLTQPIQGDDPYYLFGAQHALIDPAHPSHARYIFQGEMVDMRGHPHPPLNAWMLAGLLAIFGDVYEVPFHAAYILFSLIAALSMWSIAKRFSDTPLASTLLFLSVPAFVINGNSLEADIPFLAFWMAGFAFFFAERWMLATLAFALASLTAYQAIVATPILLLYLWGRSPDLRRASTPGLVALIPLVTIGLYQAFERFTSGALPAAVLSGYMSTYGLQQIANKLKNAAALTTHLGWMVFPVVATLVFRHGCIAAATAFAAALAIDPWTAPTFAIGAAILVGLWRYRRDFLAWWIWIFFAAALAIFFAGSARYLLPLAAPLAILCAKERRWVIPAFAANLVVGLALAWSNYQHWDGYRQFAKSIQNEIRQRRVWINGEWGLRFYLESEGALPLARTTIVQPGDWIVSSELAYPVEVTAPTAPVITKSVRSTLPLRLIGLNSRSGYSTASMGLRPFDISTNPIDRIRVDAVLERKPVLSRLPMNAPEASIQLVSGIYSLENTWRWTSERAILLLKPPTIPAPIEVKLYIPDNAPARKITISVDNQKLLEQTLPKPGPYTLTTRPTSGSSVTIEVDRTFTAPGDSRALGIILNEVAYR